MPAVSLSSLQASSEYLSKVLNEHSPSPNCKFLAERVVSFISTMLSSGNIPVPSMSTSSSSRESLESKLIDVSNPEERKASNDVKVNSTLLERRLSSLYLVVEQISLIEGFFKSYVSSSWTVRTYVNNEQNEAKAKALLQDFDEAVDKVLLELVMGEKQNDLEEPTTVLQLIIKIMNLLLPFLILLFVIVYVGEKLNLFEDVESLKTLQKHANTFVKNVFKGNAKEL